MTKSSGAAGPEAEVARRLGQVIKRAEQALTAERSAALRELDVTVPQYAALLAVAHAPGSSGAQLARACLVTPQTMATVLSNLAAKGLIERAPSSVHHRVMVTRLTRSGRALLKRADARVRGVDSRLEGAFDAAERARLAELLDRGVRALTGE